MTTRSTRGRRCLTLMASTVAAVAFIAITVATRGVIASAATTTTQSPASDSALAVTLLHEAASAALGLPVSVPTRIDVLRTIAASEVSAGDFTGALMIAREVGEYRVEIQTDITCRLLEDRQFDDAYRFTMALPERDRDWALAHLAIQFAKPPLNLRRSRLDTVDTAALVTRGLALVREVRSPTARVDALLAIASSRRWNAKDTLGALGAVRAANRELRAVRDADFRNSRRLIIADGLGAARQVDEAIAMAHSLPVDDQLRLPWSMRGWVDHQDPRVLRELRRLTTLIATTRDPNVRAYRAAGIAEALKEAADSVGAGQLLQRYPPAQRAEALSDTTLGQRSPRFAETLAYNGDVVGALALVAKFPDPTRVGLRARAYLMLADAARNAHRDTVRLILARALDDARASNLGDRMRNDLLRQVASAQLSRGFHEDGFATISLIHDAKEAGSALASVGPAPGVPLNSAQRAAIIARAANSDVRTIALAALVRSSVSTGPFDKPVAENVAWATAFVDSLPPGTAREPAQIAVARYILETRHDTSAARGRLLSLLPSHVVPPDLGDIDLIWPDELTVILLDVGARDDVLRWAHGLPDPLRRSVALLRIGADMLHRGDVGTKRWISNGPDECREEF